MTPEEREARDLVGLGQLSVPGRHVVIAHLLVSADAAIGEQ